jgi:hypothetical protein
MPRTRTAMAPGWEAHLEEVAHDAVAQVSPPITQQANATAPRDSGDLAGSYIWRWVSYLTTRIGSHLNYARHVELGTGPHVIQAKNKKALRFSVGGPFGPFLLRRRVNHPGAAAQPHLRPALYTRRRLRMMRRG